MADLSKEEYEQLMEAGDSRDFHCFIPMGVDYLEKSLKTDKDDDEKSWKIGGYASSAESDLEGESVIPSGIDTRYFLEFGWLNDDHQKGAAHKIGIPTKAMVDEKGLYIEGYLLKGVEAAQRTYTLMKQLAKGDHKRSVGFSIEGKVVLQEGSKILKSWIKDVAVTANPVNTKTYAELIKSLKTCAEDESLESMSSSKISEVDKGLEAGYQVSGQTGGDALRVQDLDQALKVLTYKSLSPNDALKYVMLKKNVSSEMAKKILRYVDMFTKLKDKQ